MYCPRCGAQVEEADRFCKQCGAALSGAPEGASRTLEPPKNKSPRRAGRKRAVVLAAILVVLLAGAGAVWAVSGGLRSSDGAQEPAGSSEKQDGGSQEEKEIQEEPSEDEVTDGTVTVSDVTVTKLDYTSIPSEYLIEGTHGKGTSLSGLGSSPYGDSLFMISAHAVNESNNSVKGWLTFSCDVTTKDDYGEKRTSAGEFSTRIYGTVEKYADNGAFYLAPGEERDVVMFSVWRDEDPGIEDWNDDMTNYGSGYVDSQVNSFGCCVISNVKVSGAGSAAFSGRTEVVPLDEMDVRMADDGDAFAYQGDFGRRSLGGEVSFTNTTGKRLESVTVGSRFAIDGELTPYAAYFFTESVSKEESVTLKSTDEGVDNWGPETSNEEGVTIVPWYVVVTTE